MGKCIVKECNSRSQKLNKSKGITFHTVPKDAVRREKWVDIIRLLRKETNWLPTKFSTICSKHFRDEDKLERKGDFGRVYLSNEAIPILNTSELNTEQSQQDTGQSTEAGIERTEYNIKVEPETYDSDPPDVKEETLCNTYKDQYIKTEIAIVKEEPLEHEAIKAEPAPHCEDTIYDEACLRPTQPSIEHKPLFLINSEGSTMLLQQRNYSFCLLPVPSKTVEVSVEYSEKFGEESQVDTCDTLDAANTCVNDTVAANTCVKDTVAANTCVKDTFFANTCVNDTVAANTCVKDTVDVNTCVKDTVDANTCVKDTVDANTCVEDTVDANTCVKDTATANYQCDRCQKIFITKTSLKRHISLQHDKITIDCKEKLFKCNICDKSYNYSSLLKIHMVSHSSEKPHKCDICGKAFGLSTALARHKRTHSIEKLYKCSTCDKAYTNPSSLFYHKHYTLSHVEDRTFKCSLCEKAFNNANGLKLHKLTHIEDEPFKCDECGKTFKRARYLKTHVRTHTGQRPYKCDVCDKAFKHSGNLASHMITHTGDKPYECNVCEKGFNQSSNLKTHLRIHRTRFP